VPIRDFISLNSPLVAVSLLFFWCAKIKKEIPKDCGAAVANKKLSGSPAVFPRDADDDRKIDHHHGNDDDGRIENRACLRRLRVEHLHNVRCQNHCARQLQVHRLVFNQRPFNAGVVRRMSIVASASKEWKNFLLVLDRFYSRAREYAESGSAVSKFLMTVLR
jgi:hypothetical protein